VLVAWEYNGEMKCSHRSAKYDLIKIINKALVGVDGYGGGHTHAAGGCVKKEDFKKYIENIREQLRGADDDQ
jgi:nanoRNase/pAp phosphatase (c-di-AMP/oligoRNAs hydrolase)